MKSSFGTNIQYTLFGESHGESIGITIQGLEVGFSIDFNLVDQFLEKRISNYDFNTQRIEKDSYRIISGYFDDKITGSPFTVIFPNNNVSSKDYQTFINHPRPGHADVVANVKYSGNNDYRGGGHFSGRLTLPLVFLGAIIDQILKTKLVDFKIVSHIKLAAEINDDSYYSLRNSCENWHELLTDSIMFNKEKLSEFLNKAQEVYENGDSLGGVIETIVINPPIGIGEPFFNSVESTISHLLFSIPSIKGVTFGSNNLANSFGSEVKDEIIAIENNRVITINNFNGGINGGITNGEDIVFSSVVKPISSIKLPQNTLNLATNSIEPLLITGRHDSTILNRIIPVINSVTLIAIYDLYLSLK